MKATQLMSINRECPRESKRAAIKYIFAISHQHTFLLARDALAAIRGHNLILFPFMKKKSCFIHQPKKIYDFNLILECDIAELFLFFFIALDLLCEKFLLIA